VCKSRGELYKGEEHSLVFTWERWGWEGGRVAATPWIGSQHGILKGETRTVTAAELWHSYLQLQGRAYDFSPAVPAASRDGSTSHGRRNRVLHPTFSFRTLCLVTVPRRTQGSGPFPGPLTSVSVESKHQSVNSKLACTDKHLKTPFFSFCLPTSLNSLHHYREAFSSEPTNKHGKNTASRHSATDQSFTRPSLCPKQRYLTHWWNGPLLSTSAFPYATELRQALETESCRNT